MKPRMKYFLFFLISSLVIACSSNKTVKIETLSDLNGKTIGSQASGISKDLKISMINNLIDGKVKDIVFFDRYIDALAALKSGKIDAIPIQSFQHDYVLQTNDDLKAIPVEKKFEGGIIMAVRNEDESLKLKLDSAIVSLKGSGKIAQLEEKWIKNIAAGNEPSYSKVVKIEGAPTYYVGVSGNIPPLDYIAANGSPSGFNVAIMNQISEMINVNFEFVSLETTARFAALSSKKIDIIFCHFKSNDSNLFDELKNQKWIGTVPYFKYKNGYFLAKK